MKTQNPKAMQSNLSPANKPFNIRPSPALVLAGEESNLESLVTLLKKVFLRLGFDGYRGELLPDEEQHLKINGTNLNTNRSES